jgi:hypothetical protein
MPRAAAAVRRALLDKGMTVDENHHHMFRKQVEGVTTLVTRMSHSGHEIPDNLAKRMANQCCLQLREFWQLVDCPLSEDGWDRLTTERCQGGRNPFMRR